MGFNDIIVLLSTDCFPGLLFNDIPVKCLEDLRGAARKSAKIILGDASDYWQDVECKKDDFDFFIGELKQANMSAMVLQRIFLFNVILNRNKDMESAVFIVQNVSSQLRHLATERFLISIDDEIIEAVMAIQAECFSVDAYMRMADSLGIDERWEVSCSKSSWDKYIARIMHELSDALCTVFCEIFDSQISMDYLWYWKDNLPNKIFIVLLQAIEDEACREAISHGQSVVHAIREVLAPFHPQFNA
jgi:hypothetical protein